MSNRKMSTRKNIYIPEEDISTIEAAEELVKYTLRSNFSEWVVQGAKRLVESKGKNTEALTRLDEFVTPIIKSPFDSAPREALEPLSDDEVATILFKAKGFVVEGEAMLKRRGFRDSDVRAMEDEKTLPSQLRRDKK